MTSIPTDCHIQGEHIAVTFSLKFLVSFVMSTSLLPQQPSPTTKAEMKSQYSWFILSQISALSAFPKVGGKVEAMDGPWSLQWQGAPFSQPSMTAFRQAPYAHYCSLHYQCGCSLTTRWVCSLSNAGSTGRLTGRTGTFGVGFLSPHLPHLFLF